MKQILFFIVPVVLLLASCSHQGTITYTEIDTLHTLRDVPVFDMAGNRLPYNAPERDTIYTYEPSGAWKASYGWHRCDIPVAIIAVVAFLVCFYFLWYRPSNKGDSKPSMIPVLCAAILALGGIVGGVTDWSRQNTAQQIHKPLYDQLENRPGALDSLMDARLKN